MKGALRVDLRKFWASLDRRKVVFIATLVIISLVVTGAVWSSKNVTVIADGKSVSVSTIHSDPLEVLAQVNIALGSKDEYRLSTAKVTDGSVLTVYRAIPVQIMFKDKTEVVISGKPTVGELATSLGYGPGKGRTALDPATKVTPMMQVRIIALTEQTVTRKVTVPPPVVRQPDPNLERGLEELADEGESGMTEATVKLRLEDGAEVGADTVSEKVLTPPKPQIVKVGTRETLQTSRGTMRFREVHMMEATAYLPTDGGGHGITASGLQARHGIVAVDPRVIPLGTRVYVPGYGLALAADTGGAIIGNRIDLCIEDHDAAWHYGRRMVKVYVLAD
jgi:3D (Asp-Asp-Asp) domain-containing protein